MGQHIIVDLVACNGDPNGDRNPDCPETGGNGGGSSHGADLALIACQHIKTAGLNGATVDGGGDIDCNPVGQTNAASGGRNAHLACRNSDRPGQSDSIDDLGGACRHRDISIGSQGDQVGIGDLSGDPGRGAHQVDPLPKTFIGIIE